MIVEGSVDSRLVSAWAPEACEKESCASNLESFERAFLGRFLGDF